MTTSLTRASLALLLAAASFACTGDAGPAGPAGPAGGLGPAGPAGPAGTSISASTDAGAGGDREVDHLDLPGAAFYPESLNASGDGSIFVGSLGTGAIVKFAPGGSSASTFLAAGGDVKNVTGVLADDAHGLLWVCAVNVSTSPPSTLGVRSYKLSDASLVANYPLPGPGFCNDMALDAAGNLFVSDSFGKVLKLPQGGKALAVWSSDAALAPSSPSGFGADGIVVDGSNLYVTAFSDSRLLRIPIQADGSAGAATTITVTPALKTPDCLRLIAPGTLAAAGGSGLVTVRIDGNNATSTPIATRLEAPTSVVRSGDSWWVSEGQLSFFLGAPGSPELPFRVDRVRLAE